MTTDRTPHAVTDVRATAIAAAAYSRSYFPELYRQFHANETVLNARVTTITGYLLKRASSDLADLLFSIDQGVDIIPAATVTAKVKYVYIAKNATEYVDITVKDAAGHPLEGIRVDVAFPTATGGTTLIRHYTTAAGTLTVHCDGRGEPIRSSPGRQGHGRDGRRHEDGDAVVHDHPPARRWLGRVQVMGQRLDRHPGQTLRVASLARDTKGHGIANLKVTWTLTFANGSVLKTVGYTDVNGKAVMTLPITSATPKGTVKVSAKTQAAGVTRYSTTSFKRT